MPEVARSIEIQAPPSAVWRWLSSPEALRRWLSPTMEIDLRVRELAALVAFEDA